MVRVLFAASEAVPFIKTGGLADVCGSLPKYFPKAGFDVRVILPKYMCIEEKWKEQMHFIGHFYLQLSWRKQYVGIFMTEWEGVIYYFLDNEYYFNGPKPYNAIHEDVEKFAFFSKAVLEAIPYLDFEPDLIHCHDWQTGLIPVFLKSEYNFNPYYNKIKTIYSIHNLKFQGRWNLKGIQDVTGLPDYLFTPNYLESYGEGNLLKGGVVCADAVATVSPTYAYEMKTVEGGEGLDGLFRMKGNSFVGIVNGIDYTEFSPEKDPYGIPSYNAKTVKKKKPVLKKNMQKKLGLPVNEKVFTIGIISRLTTQKGLDLVSYILQEMLEKYNLQLIIVGTGEEKFQNTFLDFQRRFPDKVSANIRYAEDLAHMVYAGCDAFLMPSLFEPCGLSQIISMRYGTVPIVRETGGLKDTVEAYNEFESTGTGFSFSNYNAHEMYQTIRYAKNVYDNHREQWDDLVVRCMEKDLSWNHSAIEYEHLYMQVL